MLSTTWMAVGRDRSDDRLQMPGISTLGHGRDGMGGEHGREGELCWRVESWDGNGTAIKATKYCVNLAQTTNTHMNELNW